MENRPIGREKRVVSGGGGVKRSGNGLGKTVSNRNVQKSDKVADKAVKGFLGGLFGRKK